MGNRISDRWPVIVGVGEVTDRTTDPAFAKEPLTLIEEAARSAAIDSGRELLAEPTLLRVINVMSWSYRDLPSAVCERLSISPRRKIYGQIGGETPVSHLHEAARAIVAGDAEVALVCGAEAFSSVRVADRAGLSLSWLPQEANPTPITRLTDVLSPLAVLHGLDRPSAIYPLYENACQHFWGQSPEEGRAESAALWSSLSRVAATNPHAWLKREYSAQEIATPSRSNRLVAWPYTKLMVAQPNVNQGCAIIVTSYGRARAAGIPERRMVFVRGGAGACEPRDILARDHYHGASSMDAVLCAARKLLESENERFDLIELYSCFPTVPKMARRALGLQGDHPVTVAGGLTFFGAPLSNYMGHATVAMVRQIRSGKGHVGLLYGQGEVVTKHHSVVLSSSPVRDLGLDTAENDGAQRQADSSRGPLPPIDASYSGPAHIETTTVLYDRDGEPEFGVVVARTPSGARLLARSPKHDHEAIARLTSLDQSAVGLRGAVKQPSSGVAEWHMT